MIITWSTENHGTAIMKILRLSRQDKTYYGPYGQPDRKISVIFFDDFPKGTLEKLIELESESKILMQKLKNLY